MRTVENLNVVSPHIVIPPTRGILAHLPEIFSPGERPVRMSVVVENEEVHQCNATIKDLRLEAGLEDLLRRFHGWEIVSWTSRPEPKGLMLNLRPPQSSHTLQVSTALDIVNDDGYTPSSRMEPPRADRAAAGHQDPAPTSAYGNMMSKIVAAPVAARGINLVASSGLNLARPSNISPALSDINADAADFNEGQAVDADLEVAALTAAVARALACQGAVAVPPLEVKCPIVPYGVRKGCELDGTLMNRTQEPLAVAKCLPLQVRKSESPGLNLASVLPGQNLQQLARSQSQRQEPKHQGLQAEGTDVNMTHDTHLSSDSTLGFRFKSPADCRGVPSAQPRQSTSKTAAAQNNNPRSDMQLVWTSEVVMQDGQEQHERASGNGGGTSVRFRQSAFTEASRRQQLPYTASDERHVQRGNKMPLSEAELSGPHFTAALLIPHAFLSRGIPGAQPGEQIPVVLTVDDGCRGAGLHRGGISVTEMAAEAAARSGDYPGALVVQRDGSGVLADAHISEAIAKYEGWTTVGWHVAELDDSLGGVYWVEWKVRKPPPLPPQQVLKPRGSNMTVLVPQRDTVPEAAAKDEQALMNALQKLVWQQKALEEQLAWIQARRVAQQEQQEQQREQEQEQEGQQPPPLEEHMRLYLQRQQQNIDWEDEAQAGPFSLRSHEASVLITDPSLQQSTKEQEWIEDPSSQVQPAWITRKGSAKSVPLRTSGFSGAMDAAQLHAGLYGTRVEEYDADIQMALRTTKRVGVAARDAATLPLKANRNALEVVDGNGGSAGAVSHLKRQVKSRIGEAAAPPLLLSHQRSAELELLWSYPPQQQQQQQPCKHPRLQLKVDPEEKAESLNASGVVIGTFSGGSGSPKDLPDSHSPALAPEGDSAAPLREATAATAAEGVPQVAYNGKTEGEQVDADNGAAPVTDAGTAHVSIANASEVMAAIPADDPVVARSAPRLMSRYLTSGEIRILFTERDGRVLCNPPCGLLVTIQIVLDGQPLGPPQEAQLCRYNGSSPRYLTSVPAQELTSPPIPWKRLADTIIQYRRCRSGLLQLWASRRRTANAASSNGLAEEGVVQLTSKAAAAMPKLVSFKPAGLRRAAWLAASAGPAVGSDSRFIGGEGDADADGSGGGNGGNGIIGKGDDVLVNMEAPPAPMSLALSADATRGSGPCSPAGHSDSDGAGRSRSAGAATEILPMHKGVDAAFRGGDALANTGDTAACQALALLSAAAVKSELENRASGRNSVPSLNCFVEGSNGRGPYYNTLLGELRAVGCHGMALVRPPTKPSAGGNKGQEETEPPYCTEVLVACPPRSLSRYVTKAELEMLVGPEVYEQLCGGHKLADVRVMFEVNGRRLPEIFAADIERYNASSPFYLKASSGRGVDGLPWRSVPPNATVQWKRMADNTLVLAQVCNRGCREGKNRHDVALARPGGYQRRGQGGGSIRRRGNCKRSAGEVTDSDYDTSDVEYRSSGSESEMPPVQKRWRARKAAPMRHAPQGDELLEALAGAAGRALMEEDEEDEEEAGLDVSMGMTVDKEPETAAARGHKRSRTVPDLFHRPLDSNAVPAPEAVPVEPQIPNNSFARAGRDSGNEVGGVAGFSHASVLPRSAAIGGLGVLTCPSPPQQRPGDGLRGPSSFISRIVATNLYIGRRQLQALYGPGFKADTRSEMQLSLNGTLVPEVYHVQWKEGCHKGSFYPKGAPLGQLRGRFLQGIYWLDEARNLLVAVAWDQPPADWPLRRRRMAPASSGSGSTAKPRRWLWQRQAERARKAPVEEPEVTEAKEEPGSGAVPGLGMGIEGSPGVNRLQCPGDHFVAVPPSDGTQGGSVTGIDNGGSESGTQSELHILTDNKCGAGAPSCLEEGSSAKARAAGPAAAAAAAAPQAEHCWGPTGGPLSSEANGIAAAAAAADPVRCAETEISKNQNRDCAAILEGLLPEPAAGRPAGEGSSTCKDTDCHGEPPRVSSNSSDTSQTCKRDSLPCAATLRQGPSQEQQQQSRALAGFAATVTASTPATMEAGVILGAGVPRFADMDAVVRHLTGGRNNSCPKRCRAGGPLGSSEERDEDEAALEAATKRARQLEMGLSYTMCKQTLQQLCKLQQPQGPGNRIVREQQLEFSGVGDCSVVPKDTAGGQHSRLMGSWPGIGSKTGRNGLGLGVTRTSGENSSTDDGLECMPVGESPSPPPLQPLPLTAALCQRGTESTVLMSAVQALHLVRNEAEKGGCANSLEICQKQQPSCRQAERKSANTFQHNESQLQLVNALAPLIAALRQSLPVALADDSDAIATVATRGDLNGAVADGDSECSEATDELVIRTMPWISMHLAQKWYPEAVFSTDQAPYRVQIAIEVNGQLCPERYPAQLKSYSFNNSVFLPGLPVKLVKGMIRTGWRKLKDQTLVLMVRSGPSARQDVGIGGEHEAVLAT